MKKLIMDLDVGIDDALALAYVVTLKDYELIGVTAVFGNVDQKQSQRNALSILKALGREDVPVYPGEIGVDGITPYVSDAQFVHGDNGLGNVDFPSSLRSAEKTPAWLFLSSSIERYGEELVIYASGPLTNLARLFRERPDLVERCGQIVIMGGALLVEGNVSSTAEANLINDPKAADFLFSLGLDIVVVGLDVTNRLHLEESDMESWRSSAGMKFRKMTDFYIDFHKKYDPRFGDVCILHDPAAAAYLERPELFTVYRFPVKVVCEGKDIGRTVASFSDGLPCTTGFCIDVDKSGVEKMLKSAWRGLFSV